MTPRRPSAVTSGAAKCAAAPTDADAAAPAAVAEPDGSATGRQDGEAAVRQDGRHQTALRATRPVRLGREIATWATRRPWLLAWLAFLPVAVLRSGMLTEADTFWEIRTGLITISQRAIPTVDTFSWTMRGRPWTLNSWGFNVLIAAAYRLAGLAGVALTCMALIMAAVALVLVLARQLGAKPSVTAAVLLLTAPLLVGWLAARPQLVDFAAVGVLTLLLRGIAAGRPPGRRVLAIGTLSAAWVNLHAAALLGVAICVACGVLLLLGRGKRASGMWCLAAGAAALAGSFLSPYGPSLLGQTSQVQADSAGLIVEWQHANPASPTQDLTLALGLAALVLVLRQREVVLGATLAVVLAGSVTAVRFMPFIVLVAVPVLAASGPRLGPAVLRYARSRRTMFVRCGTAGMLAFAAAAAPSLAHVGQPDPAAYPVAIIADIPRDCRVFTSDLLGGFLILARPDAPVSLDTRNTLYGRQRLLAAERVLAGHGDLVRGLAGAGCVLVKPTSGLARRLASDWAWKLTASEDPAAVLFVRR